MFRKRWFTFRMMFIHVLCTTTVYQHVMRGYVYLLLIIASGHLHLGGLRTAFYNYIFAKSRGGKFILRIEDTDQSRIVPDAVRTLENDLQWAGIVPDESPSIGGPYGPYEQSGRLPLYRDQVKCILEAGAAYYCFCTDRRLDLLRREAIKARQVPRYDNRCRHLPEAEVKKRLARGDNYCIRFKLVSNEESFEDLVYGKISYNIALNEGDPVIIKSDGYPTYHFANVVDDHFMKISHVLRGVEWQISTTKHILLYRAFGWQPPVYAHLPLILNTDGSKLSKRQGDITVDNYRREGIFPEALLNFIIDAGGGFTKDVARTKSRIYTLQELIEQFDISHVKPSSCRLTPEKLPEFNGLELRRRLADKEESAVLVQEVKELVSRTFKDRLENQKLQLQDDHIMSVLVWGEDRITRLTDLVNSNLAFLWIIPSQHALEIVASEANNIGVLEDMKLYLSKLLETEFHRDHLKKLLKDFSSEKQLPFSKLMKLLRSAVSGLQEGPGVAEMMEILGRASTLARLDHAVTVLKTLQTSK
ncbi:probable glutamate--tRNA ligase, mitochondrial isoform X2 [Zootermopsis nevadensis]|uniref:probable glutamate--tRNA ligase, mitochondrial isoform X2 n=1 Tax=Zootermopsis nevadensis TaxID=136037 RepID=UPI000B8E85BE|nr:probable glutamate--tRNA ligase, mitochondrial isoform X2 [Zootermopsis nevadensis]